MPALEQLSNRQLLGSKPVNNEFMQGLVVEENQIYPLQGATGVRPGRDPRLVTYVGANMSTSNMICYYEHMTTISHKPTGTYYIIFRETKDAQLVQQADPVKYPKWLMNHPVKDDERSVFIHIAKPNAVALLKKGVSTIGDWLDEITNPTTFNTLALFALNSGCMTEKMYGSFV